jgi:hypothetical protein
MSLKTLMTIKAMVCITLGLFLLIAPSVLYGIFGGDLQITGSFAGREYGAALIGTFLLTWYSRNAAESQPRRAIILDLFIYDAIGAVLSVVYILNGTFNPLMWAVVALYLGLAVGYGYFWFAKPAPVTQPGLA